MSETVSDLSGRWHGFYDYPGSSSSCRFTAELRDSNGMIAGETSELGENVGYPGEVLHASLHGRSDKGSVAFTKIYDHLPLADYSIIYSGTVSPDGDEIEGRWSIPGNWSGPFQMVRNRATGEAEEVSEEATLSV